YSHKGILGLADGAIRHVVDKEGHVHVGRTPITIYDVKEGLTRRAFYETLMHELGHPNDWESSASLTTDERIDMLSDIASRVLEDDRYRSAYVESISVEELGL